MIILPSTLSLSLSVSFVSSLSLFQSSFSPRFCPVHRAPWPISLSLPVGNVRPSLHHGIALVPKHYQLVDKAVWWLSFQPRQISFRSESSRFHQRTRFIRLISTSNHEIFPMKRRIFESNAGYSTLPSPPPAPKFHSFHPSAAFIHAEQRERKL